MKNIIFVLFAFLISSVSIFAQDIEIGKSYKSKKTIKSEHWQVMTDEGNTFIIQRAVGKFARKLYIRKLDKNFNLVKEKKDRVEIGSHAPEFLKAYSFNNEVYILAQKLAATYNSSRGMYLLRIDKNTLEVAETITISETERFEDRAYDLSYKVCISPDKTKIGFISVYEEGKVDKQQVNFKVFNKEMKLIWAKENTLPFTTNLFFVRDAKMDNNEDFYILSRIFQKPQLKNIIFGKDQKYDTKLYVFRDKSTNQEVYPVTVSGAEVGDSKILVKPNGNLVCAGYYITKYKRKKAATGLFYKEIGKEKKALIANSKRSFDKKTIEAMRDINGVYDVIKVRGSNLDILTVNYLLLKENGEIILIGEKQYSLIDRVDRNDATDTRSFSTTTYRCDDIIVTTFNKEGGIKWTTRIAKEQKGSGIIADLSFVAYLENDNLNLIYNLSKRKEDKPIPQYYAPSMKPTLINASIDQNGKVTTKKFFETKENLKKMEGNYVVVPLAALKEELENVIIIFLNVKKGETRVARIK
ncbi:hypothetical protein Fleli_2636 [Bernardetia litoralis DSM 6794]|uniref:Uncharacterized protein n=1 Tax=Bernardetia litoralis (strain ATCC 23117 / DSM 6794 / NBRC 15988 / NCIMB 1366 / Fx l1 / Sio-4) TaxID=880071 RepID=I4AM12_BERLS|nr:hypothetical protein [Bernardetia litoralis]AFM04997.1 hypothetical protein Fleli_2636 [Bernardetia litoralis DSM 6794]